MRLLLLMMFAVTVASAQYTPQREKELKEVAGRLLEQVAVLDSLEIVLLQQEEELAALVKSRDSLSSVMRQFLKQKKKIKHTAEQTEVTLDPVDAEIVEQMEQELIVRGRLAVMKRMDIEATKRTRLFNLGHPE